MCHIENKKGENGRNRSAKSGKYQNTHRKRKLQLLMNIGSSSHQTDERKINKRIPHKNQKTSQTKHCRRNIIKGISMKESISQHHLN